MQSNNVQMNSTSDVMLVPSESNRSNAYTNMRCIPSIRAFSCLSIILGLTSIGLQIAALCTNVPWYSFDPVGHGIWAGAFYIIAGSLGLASASKKTRALLITTVVFASLSIASAIVAAVLSGISADFSYCSSSQYGYNCNAWYSLEWTLMGFSIGAIFNSITLTIFSSIALCKGRRKSVQTMVPYTAAGPTQGHVQPMPYIMSYPNQGFVPVYPMQQNHLVTGGFNTQPLFAVIQQPAVDQDSNNTATPSVVQHQAAQLIENQNNQPQQK